jgi:hypothetical protein
MATVCNITRSEFRTKAPSTVKVTVECQGKVHTFLAQVKEYDSGSLGFCLSDKAMLTLDGRDVKCQVGMNITLVGSKELPKDEPTKAAA